MKLCQMLLALLFCAVLSVSCSRNGARAKESSSPLQPGGLYSLNDGEGGFRVGKIVAAEDEVVFVRLFSDRWTVRPTLDKARKASLPAALAFSVQSFDGMQPVRLENGIVSAEELESYESWKESKRDIF